jgi:hypothetical protein
MSIVYGGKQSLLSFPEIIAFEVVNVRIHLLTAEVERIPDHSNQYYEYVRFPKKLKSGRFGTGVS